MGVRVCVHAKHEYQLFQKRKHFFILKHLQVDVKTFYLGMKCIPCFALHVCPFLHQSYMKAHTYVQP